MRIFHRFPRLLALGVACSFFGLHGNSNVEAAQPTWWTSSGINLADPTPHPVQENYAPANVGQLKNMAKRSKTYLERGFDAGIPLDQLIGTFSKKPEDYGPANLGQLKNVAKAFYDRLKLLGFDTKASLIAHGYPVTWSSDYPWPANSTANNYAPVNIGQLKAVFSFDLGGKLFLYSTSEISNSFFKNTSIVTVPVNTTSSSLTAYTVDQSGYKSSVSTATWSISGGRVLSGSGSSRYLSSSTTNVPGTYTVTATNAGVSASGRFVVYTPALAALALGTPLSSRIQAGASRTYTATAYDTYGRTMTSPALTWVVSPTNGGSLNGSTNTSRTFNSNGTPGTYTITASSGSVITPAATLEVYTPITTTINITPTSPVTLPGTIDFDATCYDLYGTTMYPPVTWSVTGGQSINGSTGLFTTGSTAGTFTVTASAAPTSKTTTVTVIPSLAGMTSLQAVGRNTRVVLSWQPYAIPSGTSLVNYKVYRAASAGGTFQYIGQTTDTTYIDPNLQNGTTYWYRITAVLSDSYSHQLESAPSNVVSAASVAPPPIGTVDMVFIIDNTGSMGGAITNIQKELQYIISDINVASGHNYRTALVTPDTDTFNVRLVFSDLNGSQLSTSLAALVASGGGSTPESTDWCLKNVLDATNGFTPAFRVAAKKVVILITDAVPGGTDDTFVADPTLTNVNSDEYHAYQYASQAQTQGVVIGAVAVGDASGDPAFYRIMHNYYAQITAPAGQSPVYIQVPANGVGSAAAVLNIIYQTQ